MAQHNADQVADWKGQSGERWVTYQARLDAMMAVFGRRARHGRTRAGRRLRRRGF